MSRTLIDCPVGPLRLTADEAGLREIRFLVERDSSGRDATAAETAAGAGARPAGERGRRPASDTITGAVATGTGQDDRGATVLAETARQLRAYFAGELHDFDLPLAPRGTPFQLAVWRALTAVRYGETTSYGELAARVGRPRAVRAVGAANGANPLPIVIPCHRVIGADGSLTGYGGGLPVKRALLALERGPGPPRLPFD